MKLFRCLHESSSPFTSIKMLSVKEISILNRIAKTLLVPIPFSDHSSLEEPKNVKATQEPILEALKCYVGCKKTKKSYDAWPIHGAQIVSACLTFPK